MSNLIEKNLLPDGVIRLGIRRLLAQRLRDESAGGVEAVQERQMALWKACCQSPIAVLTQAANEQHYEVPTDFYLSVLGPHLKYSSGYWRDGVTSIEESEAAMLALTCERADLMDGQRVLELGCGWGSLTLWMAAHYPNSRITAVSNSRTQKQHIDAEAKKRGLTNVTIITADMNTFDAGAVFDRVVSVEMFEHMRNHQKLLARVAGWLVPGGKLFVHIFTHKEFTYLFEVSSPDQQPAGTPAPEKESVGDWMSKYFFSGGMMPSDHWLLYDQDHFALENHWRVSGTHYQKTSEAWLSRMDQARPTLWPLFTKHYGEKEALRWWVYWRIFFMSCAELWGYRGGGEWFVSHYLFAKRQPATGNREP